MFIIHEAYKPKNIHYKFFTRNIPESKHQYLHHHESHKQDNQVLAEHFGAKSIAFVDQKHTNKVIITNDYNNYCVADGQATNKSNIALAVVTADCVPILLADDEAKVIAAVHAGWRGARADIIEEAVKRMHSLGANKITAIIGPCIRQNSYEVSEEFYQNFTQESAGYKKFFINSLKQNHFMFDLPGYVKSKLGDLGVQQIFDLERNTYEEEGEFFSFRRTTHNPDSMMGSLASVIMLLD